MAELGLNCLDRVTVRDGLARDRTPAKRVMTQRSEPSCPLDGHHGAFVAVDIAWDITANLGGIFWDLLMVYLELLVPSRGFANFVLEQFA
jgi:hypothetical protein